MSVSIEAPHTIAALPVPLDATNGKTRAAPVYSLRGSRKRKRHEVAVGVDGETVNIYNAQNQSLVTSYAIPSHSYLCCPPCSVYRRRSQTSPAQRRTYVVLKDGQKSKDRRLVCFTEDLRQEVNAADELQAPQRKECRVQQGDIVSVETIPRGDRFEDASTGWDVLVTHASGHAVAWDEELKTQLWQYIAESQKTRVEYVAILDLESARKGLLKEREDLLAAMGNEGSMRPMAALCCRIVNNEVSKTRELQLMSIKARPEDAITTFGHALEIVMRYTLPIPRYTTENAIYDFHAPTGKLCQLQHSQVTVLDLARTVPAVAHNITTSAAVVDGIARLTHDSYITLSGSGATVIETKYGSTRATTSFSSSKSGVREKKRKREGEETTPSSKLEVISSFAETGLIAAISGNNLVGIQINDDLKTEGRPKSQGFLLVDLLNRDSQTTGLKTGGAASEQAKRLERWRNWQSKADNLIEEGDLEGLEALVAHDLGLSKQQKAAVEQVKIGDVSQQPDNDANTEGNASSAAGTISTQAVAWDLSRMSQNSRQDNLGKALYIFGRMFGPAVEEPYQSPGIELSFLSPKLLHWIGHMGCLSTTSLQQALDKYESLPAAGITLKPGDLFTSFLNFSNDFLVMREVLGLPCRLEISDTTQALKLLVQSFDTTPSRPNSPFPLPTAGELASSQNPATPNKNAIPENNTSTLDTETDLAEHELEHAYQALNHGLEARSDALRHTLARLHAFPQRETTASMRAMLSHQDLRFFINILRIELADGGWTRRYVDGSSTPTETSSDANTKPGDKDAQSRPLDGSITVISDMLNATIDAVGMSGWLVGMAGDNESTAEVIDTLSSEIGAGLEGCYQNFSLEGFLQELGRYGPLIEAEERAKAEEGVEGAAMMPLGGRSEALDRERRGGKGRKGKSRVAAREHSRRVGLYEIDHIRL
ncbi:hypothetical protein MBLNU230_g0028t1 [Neophaeotheca triangularis]